MKIQGLIVFFIILLMISSSNGGPVAFGVCQAGCAAVVVACYAAAGVTFGTITAGASTPAVILACNSAFGTCMSAANAAWWLPTL